MRIGVYSFFNNFNCLMPFWALFLNETYFYTSNDIILFFSIYSFVVFLLEIPVGFISDRLGAKLSMFIGLSLKLFSLILFFFNHNFIIPFVSQVFVGIGESFCSGSRDVFIYRYYKSKIASMDFHKFNSRLNSLNWAGIISSFFIASIVQNFGYNIILVINIFALIIALVSILSIKDFKEEKINKSVSLKSQILIVKDSMHNNHLNRFLILTAIIQGGLSSMFVLFQPLLSENNMASSNNGFLYCIVSLFAILGSEFIPYIRRKVKNDMNLLFSVSFIMSFICLLLSLENVFQVVVLILFALFRFLFGFSGSAISGMINLRIIDENVRASIFSIQSLLLSFIQFIILFILQTLSISTQFRYFILMWVLLFFSLILFYSTKKNCKFSQFNIKEKI